MFRTLSLCSTSLFLGWMGRDWNLSGLARRELSLYQDDANGPCIFRVDSVGSWLLPIVYNGWSTAYIVRLDSLTWYGMLFLEHVPQKGPKWWTLRTATFHCFPFITFHYIKPVIELKSNQTQWATAKALSIQPLVANEWLKESNALPISVDKIVISFFRFTASFQSSTSINKVVSQPCFLVHHSAIQSWVIMTGYRKPNERRVSWEVFFFPFACLSC